MSTITCTLMTRKYTSQSETLVKIETCVAQVKSWMTSDKLKSNEDKTEIRAICRKGALKKLHATTINIAGSDVDIVSAGSIRSLGVLFDPSLSMNEHVTSICKSVHFHLRNIGMIRHLIDKDTAKLLVNSFITSRIDYCNSFLAEIPKCQLNRLQKLQNKAARIVTRSKLSEHITPILGDLHWLPVEYRVKFKILCFTYNCRYGTAPPYLTELLNYYKPVRSLRSSTHDNYAIPRVHSVFGQRAFSYNAPKLWNALPSNIKKSESLSGFKRALKTHFYQLCF